MFAGGKKIEGVSAGGVSVPFETGQWLAHRVKDRFYDLEAEIIATDLHPKKGKEPSVTLRYCGSGSVVTRNADELFRTLRENIKAGMRLITGKKSGGIMPEEAGAIFDFRAGQQIAVSGNGSFRELAEIIAVDENSGRPRVKIRYSGYGYGYGEPGREVWVDARELSAEILVNGRERWELVEEGEKIEIDAVPLDSRIKTLGEELKKIGLALDPRKRAKFVLSEAMRAMREAREILWKDFQSWRALQIRENEHNYRFDRLGTSLGNYLGGGSFIDAEDDIGREENTRRLAEIKELDRKIVLYGRALKGMEDGKHIAEVIGLAELEREMPLLRLATEEKLGAVKFDDAFEIEFGHLRRIANKGGWRETVDAYAAVQLLYLKYHPQARSTLLDRINQMIALGVIETPLRAVATSSDLLLIENDVRIYNEELAIELGVKGGPKLSAGYGRISPDDLKIEILRLREMGKKIGKKVMRKMDSAAKIARPLVKENQGSMSREVRVATAYVRGAESVAGGSVKVGGAVAVGAWDVLNDPSTSVMLLSGVGVAGPMWRAVTTRLIAAGVSAERAAVLATTASGLTFHAANSTINFGLDALPGVNRSDHVDYTPEGFLRSVLMIFTIGEAQALYGGTLKPYLRFLSERPLLQAALDGAGGKTFEILGLATYTVGVDLVHGGWDALSPNNIYRNFLESTGFVIAYGAMHAGRHSGRKGPAQRGYERAVERWEGAKKDSAPDNEIEKLAKNVVTAFDAAQKEALQAFKHDLSLGKRRLGEVKGLVAKQRENLRGAIREIEEARNTELDNLQAVRRVGSPDVKIDEDLAGGNRPNYNFTIDMLRNQIEILDALWQKIDRFAEGHDIKDAAAPPGAPLDAEAATPLGRTENVTPPNGSHTTPSRPGSPFSRPASAKLDDTKDVPGGPVAERPASSLVDEIAATQGRIARLREEQARLAAAERAAAVAAPQVAITSGLEGVSSPSRYPLGKVRKIILRKLPDGESPLRVALTAQLERAEIEAPAGKKWKLPRHRLIAVLVGAIGNVSSHDRGEERTGVLGDLVRLVDELEGEGLWLALHPELRRQYTLAAKELGHKRNRTALLAELVSVNQHASHELKRIIEKGPPNEKDFLNNVVDSFGQLYTLLHGFASLGRPDGPDWGRLWQTDGELTRRNQLDRARTTLRVMEEGDVIALFEKEFGKNDRSESMRASVDGLKAALEAEHAVAAAAAAGNKEVTAAAEALPAAPAGPRTIAPPSDPDWKLEAVARDVIWRGIGGGRGGAMDDVLTAQLVGYERNILARAKWELSRERLIAVMTGALRDVMDRGDDGRTTKLLTELVELADELERAGLWLMLDSQLREQYNEAASRLHRKRNRTALLAELHQIDAGAGIEWRGIINNGYVSEKALVYVIRDRLGQVYTALNAMATVCSETGTPVLDFSLLWKAGGLMTNPATLANLRELLRIIEEGDVLGIRERDLKDDVSFDSLPKMVATLKAALDAEPKPDVQP